MASRRHARSRPPSDTARQVAFDPRAPAAERFDANAELQKAHLPGALEQALFPHEDIREVVNFIRNDLEQQALQKASAGAQIIPYPGGRRAEPGPVGMRSLQLDDMWINVQGEWWEKPGVMGFDAMRMMVDQTPVLSAVVLTRIRQVQSFCRPQESGRGRGFVIRHTDPEHQLSPAETKAVSNLAKFFSNCGFEDDPRKRKRLKRENFSQFMGKLVRDTLTLDSMPIETEFKRNAALGIDGMYAVDGATIRLCTEQGYEGDDEIFALQVVQGVVRTAYTFQDLIYEPRNPRTDVLACGYGLSETELLVRTVTGFLNAMTLNIRGFTDNSIPRGVLHLTGNYGKEDIEAMKRYWNAMVRGVNNSWTVPLMISKDQESKAGFENFGVEFDEMYFAKWMTFLTAIICAIYGMDPAEINFESFAASKSSLSGSDTEERLVSSQDRGLAPLLSHFENIFSDYVLRTFDDQFVFRFPGLDEIDEQTRHERKKLTQTVNEMRAEDGMKKMDSPLGAAPVNASLVQPWLQMMQAAAPEDYGDPAGQTSGGPPAPGEQPAPPGAALAGADGGPTPGGGGGDASGADDEGRAGPIAGPKAVPLDEGSGSLTKALDFGQRVPRVYEVAP